MGFSEIMGVKLITFLVVSFLVLDSGFSGDPCPNKHDLLPCTCDQVPVILEDINMDLKMGELVESTTSPMPTSTGRSTNLLQRFSLNKPPLNESNLIMAGRNDTFYTVVTCKNLRSLSVLEEAINKGLHRKWVDRLTVYKVPPVIEHTLAHLPASWLKNLRVTQLEIRDSIMAGYFMDRGNPFEGQEKNLLWLTATNCHLSGRLTYEAAGTTNIKRINTLTRLEGLDLSRNLFVYIESSAFRHPPANLTVVNLSYNSIQSIEHHSFAFIGKLTHIDLSHNLLTSPALHRNMFKSPEKTLQHIDISWNQLTSLPLDYFTNMPALKIVNLQSNFLSALSEKPWATVWRQLTLIELTGNFLECDCEILWLLDILSPPKNNSVTTPAPRPLPGQRVLGSCGHTEPQHFKIPYKLTKLTRANINCGA